ncbi:uncharacterized protein LOC126219615 [Schistocerca nitens]|uniref:uncharacterized protein LOC126219615 n=1 Tax=Schistocerca nitens TaxID=7011 RepID=UPI0021197EAE|nr:uncharacterized protein LOC126219615 [Schistocerca nitens]
MCTFCVLEFTNEPWRDARPGRRYERHVVLRLRIELRQRQPRLGWPDERPVCGSAAAQLLWTAAATRVGGVSGLWKRFWLRLWLRNWMPQRTVCRFVPMPAGLLGPALPTGRMAAAGGGCVR